MFIEVLFKSVKNWGGGWGMVGNSSCQKPSKRGMAMAPGTADTQGAGLVSRVKMKKKDRSFI